MNLLKPVINGSIGESVKTSGESLLEGVRLIIDARKVRDGGIGRYIVNLLDGLSTFTAAKLTVLCFPQDKVYFDSRYSGKVRTIAIRVKLYSPREMIARSWGVPWKEFDLVHFPHFTVPLGISIPSVVTIHDLIQITHPEKWYYPYIGKAYIWNALKRVQSVIAVSHQTYGQLTLYNRKGSTINVIPNSIGRRVGEQDLPRREMLGVQPGYFLSVLSNGKPHKGLDRLMEAYRILSSHYDSARSMLPACGLILVGSGAPKGSFSGGMGMGRVSEAELAWYYANARGIVVASDVEGFCLPVIEGRRFGVPAVVTPIPAIKEIISKYDVVSDGFSASALASAMSDLLEMPFPHMTEMHKELERYDLNRTILQIVRTYEEAIRTSGKSEPGTTI